MFSRKFLAIVIFRHGVQNLPVESRDLHAGAAQLGFNGNAFSAQSASLDV